MARQPFVKFRKFDVEALVDYGRPYYDNNAKLDGRGDSLLTAKQRRESQCRHDAAIRARRTTPAPAESAACDLDPHPLERKADDRARDRQPPVLLAPLALPLAGSRRPA